MKVGVLSDTHLNEVTGELQAIYDRYLADKDIILHAGDVVSTDVVNFLNRKNFHGVYGNMDPFEVQALLPRKKVITLGGYRIGLIHGWGGKQGIEDRIFSEFDGVDIIIYGHSHHAVNHTRKGILFFNPGTATGFSSTDTHTIGVLELNETIRSEIIKLS